jgi:putative transposase
MDGCAQKYKGFCNKYKPKQKTPKKSHWGSRLLGGITLNFEKRSSQKTKKCIRSVNWGKKRKSTGSVV